MTLATIRAVGLALLLALSVATVAALWRTAIIHHDFDYDEIEHAHATWLVAQGERPFVDFFEVHPPFGWWALAPLTAAVSKTIDLLLVLRVLSAAGSAAAIALLGYSLHAHHRDLPVAWIFAGILPAAVVGSNVAFFAEFRIDSWPLAMIIGASMIATAGGGRTKVRSSAAAFIVAAAVLISPKFALLGCAWYLVEIAAATWRERAEGLRTAVAMAAGGAFATLLATGTLIWKRIPLSLAFDLIVRFNAAGAHAAQYERPLVDALRDELSLLTLVGLGFASWVLAIARRKIDAAPLEIAIALFLVGELATVPFPYKQYVGPWFVLAAVFPPFFFHVFEDWGSATAQTACALLLVCSIRVGTSSLEHLLPYRGMQTRRDYLSYLADAGVTGRTVVMPVPSHPIEAFDASWYWMRTIDPLGPNDSEAVLSSMGGAMSRRLTVAAYTQELERARPVVVMDRDLSPMQTFAVRLYLLRHFDEYEVRSFRNTRAWFRRPG